MNKVVWERLVANALPCNPAEKILLFQGNPTPTRSIDLPHSDFSMCASKSHKKRVLVFSSERYSQFDEMLPVSSNTLSADAIKEFL